ncbi:tetratricopeptide repeat protein [Adhaeribacter sp. BT258]|uniref:Tetratricopeptide repeat protein n=1 Tax=Adhaeribacter terrigena TaxID=2793070 RepID=A0ABS1C2Y1_9BACT|nr:tetratricopeptide repeat protein [Adhaeribacter terrigena]MBK0403764.1 tetratricopeptide repeat protein [Adhaeribacter terrigena]
MQTSTMRKARYLLLAFSSVILTTGLGGCSVSSILKKGQAEQKISVVPQVLEVNGENVLFEVKAQIPKELIQKKPVYSIDLVYNYGPKMVEPIGKMRFSTGEFIYENDKPTITRQYSFKYTPEKSRGKLLATPHVAKVNKAGKRGKTTEIASGVITTSKLVVKSNTVSLAPDDYRKGVSEPQTLTFFFDEGQAKLRDYLGTNMGVLKELIESNYKTTLVEITAGHSPEDADSKEFRLPLRRAQALEKYYKHELDVKSYTNSSKSVKFRVMPVVRNWDRFLKQVQLSALSPDQINEILTIVNSNVSFKEKERQLAKLDSYEYLQLYVYPTLRYADVRITYEIPQKKDSEIYLLSKKIVENRIDSDKLTEEELRYSATLTPLLSEKLKIYQAAAENTMKWQAFNNLGVTYIQLAQQALKPEIREKLLKEAIINLTYASHRNPTAQLFYNLGSAHHIQGNYLEALRSYDYAIKLGGRVEMLQQVFADKAALEIEIGQLDDAVTSLAYAAPGYQTLMNKALLYTLKGNYQDSKTFYEEALALKPNDALAHYCLAVIAARTNQENDLALHLRKATQLEKNLTAKAIDDPEFRAYVKTPVFREAVK